MVSDLSIGFTSNIEKINHTCACLIQPVLDGQSRVPQVQVRHIANKGAKPQILLNFS